MYDISREKKHVMSNALFKLFIIQVKLIDYISILNIYIVILDFFLAQFVFFVESVDSNIKTKKNIVNKIFVVMNFNFKC